MSHFIVLTVVTAVSLIPLLWQQINWRRRIRGPVFETPPRPTSTTPIVVLAQTGTATCRGKVVGSDETFRSPTGKTVVWYECVIRRLTRGDEGGYAYADEPPLLLREASPFEIDDGSGDRLRVLPNGGYLLPDVNSLRPARVDGAVFERVRGIVLGNGKTVDSTDQLMVAETYLAADEEALVRGAVRPAVAVSYRENARTHRVVCAQDSTLWVWAPERESRRFTLRAK